VNEDLIIALQGPTQPEWQQVLVRDKQQAQPPLFRIVCNWRPPAQEANKEGRKRLQEAAFSLTQLPGSWSKGVRRQELNERFGLAHLRHDLGSDSETAAKPGGGTGHTEPADVPDPGMYEMVRRVSILAGRLLPAAHDRAGEAARHQAALPSCETPPANHTGPDPGLLKLTWLT